MPSLEKVTVLSSPPVTSQWQEALTFVSPDGGLTAVFSEPYEFRMGAYEWRLQILRAGREVTQEFGTLPQRGLHCPHRYQPWSHDAQSIFVATWRATHFYKLASDELLPRDFGPYILSAQGSRQFPRFLVTSASGFFLTDTVGSIVAQVDVQKPPFEQLELRWFDSLGLFFALTRSSRTSQVEMHWFDAMSGIKRQVTALDPFDIFPYDRKRYHAIQPDHFSLVLGPSQGCVGYFLDIWSSVDVDEKESTVRLRTYRPIGEVFSHKGMPVCRVEEKWAEARFVDSHPSGGKARPPDTSD